MRENSMFLATISIPIGAVGGFWAGYTMSVLPLIPWALFLIGACICRAIEGRD